MYSKFISAIECLKKTVKLGFLHYWHDIYVHTGFLVLKTWVACLFSKANRIYHLLWIDNCMVLTSMLSHPAATPFVEGSRGNLTVLWFSHNMPFVWAESLAVRCFSFERTIILYSHLKKKKSMFPYVVWSKQSYWSGWFHVVYDILPHVLDYSVDTFY